MRITPIRKPIQKAKNNKGEKIFSPVFYKNPCKRAKSVVKNGLKYCNGDFNYFKKPIIELAFCLINRGMFANAQSILEIVNSQDQTNADVYWGLCLIKAKAKTEGELITSEISVFEEPEFDKYLTFVDSARRHECINLKHRRDAYLEKKRLEEYQKQQEKAWQAKVAEEKRAQDRRDWELREKEDNKKKVIFGLKIAGFLLCYAILVAGIIAVVNYYDFFYDELGIELEGILPVIFIGTIGLIGSLTTFAFGWWEEFPGIARVLGGFILAIFINVIMLVMSIVALIVLIVRGYDYY